MQAIGGRLADSLSTGAVIQPYLHQAVDLQLACLLPGCSLISHS
jgi:hypothetical protein